ncbi:hypothetical protein [Paracoccus simplex]|uniref:Uncharacterized protein n=2 Tax=Paracoccus TaxID=265 RepID=A0ABV7RWS8_9RHOB
MPHQAILASTLIFGVFAVAAVATASVITTQSMGMWVDPPKPT